VLTNVEHLLHYLSVDHSKLLSIQSDHYPITFEVSTFPEPGESKVGSQFKYHFSKGDYIGMCSYLFDTDFSCLTSLDVETSWNVIKSTVLGAIDLFIPKIKTTTHVNQPVWFNSNIRHQIKCVQINHEKEN